MRNPRREKSGQAIIFLMVVMVIGILAVVWSYDLHRVVNAKLRMRNAGDAAALSAARWQGYTLNMIGDLNLIQAAIIAEYVAEAAEDGEELIDTPSEAYELHELRARLDFVGPLAAFAVAQQAAFNNGAMPDPALAESLLRMAADYRDEISWNPYDNARDEYADLLENIAVRGVAVSSYGLQLPQHPLVQEPFYGAIAQALAEWWCPMHRYRYQLESYEGYESWSKLDMEEL
ncbi:MAG: pilus assembly protein TadG-related protein, partial [Pontiella sp.]